MRADDAALIERRVRPHARRMALFRLVALIPISIGAGFGRQPASAQSPSVGDDAAWQALREPAVVLFRHTSAPGVGDPPGMRLDDCKTQRNLDDEGRQQARRIGQAFRQRGIDVQAVLHSRWCRARDTARLAFGDRARDEAVFDSFFNDRVQEPQRTAAARALVDAWRGPGVLVVVSHQVNINAITGRFTRSGEGIVLRRRGDTMEVVGSVAP